MTRPNITPGPWYLGKRAGAKRAIYGDKGAEIALPFDFFMQDEAALANARAIAAVPALLEALEAMLEMHGIEALRGEWQNGYWGDVVATYLNTGDTYAPTVILRRGASRYDAPRYLVSSWGDFVESNPRLFPQ